MQRPVTIPNPCGPKHIPHSRLTLGKMHFMDGPKPPNPPCRPNAEVNMTSDTEQQARHLHRSCKSRVPPLPVRPSPCQASLHGLVSAIPARVSGAPCNMNRLHRRFESRCDQALVNSAHHQSALPDKHQRHRMQGVHSHGGLRQNLPGLVAHWLMKHQPNTRVMHPLRTDVNPRHRCAPAHQDPNFTSPQTHPSCTTFGKLHLTDGPKPPNPPCRPVGRARRRRRRQRPTSK